MLERIDVDDPDRTAGLAWPAEMPHPWDPRARRRRPTYPAWAAGLAESTGAVTNRVWASP